MKSDLKEEDCEMGFARGIKRNYRDGISEYKNNGTRRIFAKEQSQLNLPTYSIILNDIPNMEPIGDLHVYF